MLKKHYWARDKKILLEKIPNIIQKDIDSLYITNVFNKKSSPFHNMYIILQNKDKFTIWQCERYSQFWKTLQDRFGWREYDMPVEFTKTNSFNKISSKLNSPKLSNWWKENFDLDTNFSSTSYITKLNKRTTNIFMNEVYERKQNENQEQPNF